MNWAISWHGLTGMEWIIATSLALVIALGSLAYVWPAPLPGPLLAHERHSRRVTLRALVVPALLLLTPLFATSLVVDLHDRRTLLLISRGRPSPPDCNRVTWPLSASSSSVCTIEGVDLGPVVDETLARLDRDSLRSMSTSEIVSLATPGLRRAIASIGDHETTFASASRTFSDLPRWLVDSVELELVQVALADERFDELLVAPGPFEANSMWQTVAELNEVHGVETTLVHELEAPARAYVQAVPLATYEQAGHVQLWALISGELREHQPFSFSVNDAAARLETHVQLVPPDDFQRRLVSVKFACGRCASLKRALTVVASSDESPTAEGQLLPAADREQLLLRLSGNIDAGAGKHIRSLLSGQVATTRKGQHILNELNGLGLPVPRLAMGDSLGAIQVEQSGKALLLAASEPALNAARRWREQYLRAGDSTLAELAYNKLGPNTSWSFEKVTALARVGLDHPTEQAALSGLLPLQTSPQSPRKGALAGLGTGWGVLMLPVPSEHADSLETVPFLRTLAWTAAHVKLGDSGLKGTERGELTSGPIRTISTQRDAPREARLTIRQGILLVVLFACYLIGWRRVRRALQPVRVSV